MNALSAWQIQGSLFATPAALAALHRAAFGEAGWQMEFFTSLLSQPGTQAWVASPHPTPLPRAGEGSKRGAENVGFILYRVLFDEAEILTLAVNPAWQRQGAARALVHHMLQQCRSQGVTVAHLEVAEDNQAAIALYSRAGFKISARRKAYYARPGGNVDALVMRRVLDERCDDEG